MKVILNCKYGKNKAGSTVDLDKKIADGLVSHGQASVVKVSEKKKDK